MQKFISFIILLVFLSACGKEPDVMISNNEADLIIGLTYGECLGDCSHLYKLEMGELFADEEETWWRSSDDPIFSDEALNNPTSLAEIERLATAFPEFLIQTEETRFGCPDCGDWGALHVIKNIDGQERYWNLDNQIESNPKEIQEWTLSMQTLIYDLLN